MKVLTKLFVIFVGLASLWCGVGPARADWAIDSKPASGYPIQNAEGGSGEAYQNVSFTPNGPVPYVGSDESSNPIGTRWNYCRS